MKTIFLKDQIVQRLENVIFSVKNIHDFWGIRLSGCRGVRCQEENDRIEGVAIVQSTLYLDGSARDCFAKGRESYCSEM